MPTRTVSLLRAVRPALARVSGSLLVVIGSPYARQGELFRTWSERYGSDDDDVLVVASDTATLNPTFDTREIERAFREDPTAAWSEYGRDGDIRFRSDVSAYVNDEAITAVVPSGVRELAPDPTREVLPHFDAATGSGATLRHWASPTEETRRSWRRYGDGSRRFHRGRWRRKRRPCSEDTTCHRSRSTGLHRDSLPTCSVERASRASKRRLTRRPRSANFWPWSTRRAVASWMTLCSSVSSAPSSGDRHLWWTRPDRSRSTGHDDVAAACAFALVRAARQPAPLSFMPLDQLPSDISDEEGLETARRFVTDAIEKEGIFFPEES